MVASTASNYYNKINTNYPAVGKDNDSQGFRDNFANIKNAFSATNAVVESLRIGMVTTSTVNNFGFNTINQANLQNCSINIFDDTANTRSGNVTVNYKNGSYQRFKIASGSTNFTITNWPTRDDNPTGLNGNITLSITPTSTNATVIDFPGATIVGETSLPLTVTNGLTIFFELWTDDGGTTIYVNQIGYKSGVVAEAADVVANNSLTIGTNRYSTGTGYSTIVETNTGTGVTQVGRLAVLRDRFTTQISTTSYVLGTTSSNYFMVKDLSGVYSGATIIFSGTSTTYTVDYTNSVNNQVNTTAYFSVPSSFSVNSTVTFISAYYSEQATISTFKTSRSVSTTTGIMGDLKGEIYANTNTLYVAYDDYGNSATTNWTKFYDANTVDNIASNINSSIGNINSARLLAVGTSATTVTTATTSTVLANAEFVHRVIPYGTVILWYGNTSNVPIGWNLCDGTNGTPDLRNKFIIGADATTGGVASSSITGSPTTSGGTKDAIVVTHNHTITDPGHHHSGAAQYPSPSGAEQNQSPAPADDYTQFNVDTGNSTTGITIDSTGSDGTNKNLPPYVALCYIMKVTGQGLG